MQKIFGSFWSYKLFRFLIIGGINTVFGYGMFSFLIFIGLSYKIAIMFGTILGVFFNFNTIGRIVFNKFKFVLIFKFILVYTLVYLLNIFLFQYSLKQGMNIYLSGLVCIPFIAGASYFLNKKIVFN